MNRSRSEPGAWLPGTGQYRRQERSYQGNMLFIFDMGLLIFLPMTVIS